MNIPEDVKKLTENFKVVKKVDYTFEDHEIYHAYNPGIKEGYPFVILRNDVECTPIDMSDEKYNAIWPFLLSD